MIDKLNSARMERIRYIHALLGELRALAQAERCEMLTYMIEMAYIESNDIVHGQRPVEMKPSAVTSPKQGNSIG